MSRLSYVLLDNIPIQKEICKPIIPGCVTQSKAEVSEYPAIQSIPERNASLDVIRQFVTNQVQRQLEGSFAGARLTNWHTLRDNIMAQLCILLSAMSFQSVIVRATNIKVEAESTPLVFKISYDIIT